MKFETLKRNQKRIFNQGVVWTLVFVSFYLTTLYSDLLSHTLAEMFRVAVAVAIFMLIWNVRRSLDNSYLLFMGVAYIFVGALDIVHTISFRGMQVFPGYGANLPAQLWIAARYLEGLSLLLAAVFLGRKLTLSPVLSGYVLATALLLGSIFYWQIFPACFVEGAGPTPFKKVSEYIISLILLGSATVLLKKRDRFDPAVLRLLVAAIAFTLISELCFSFFVDAKGMPNLLGHFFKIISFYCIYKAIIETGMTKPLSVLFRNLKKSEEALRGERDFIEAVLSTQDVMVAVLDREGRIVRVNKASEQLSGYSFNEIKGRPPWDLVVPGESDELKAMLLKDISAPTPRHRENSLVAKDGRLVWVLWSSSVILDENGRLEYLIVSGIDITERKRTEELLQKAYSDLDVRVQERTKELAKANEWLRAEIQQRQQIEEALRESETKYRTVADNTYDWEWWRDPEGQFIYVSPSCKKITQYEADQFIADGDLLLRIIHPDDRTSFIKHQDDVEHKGISGEIEFRIIRPDRSIRWLAHACQPVFDEHGRRLGRRGSNRDITERKMADLALSESEKKLRGLSSRLLTAQETERRRVSRELHDELGGALAVLKLRLSFVEKKLTASQPEFRHEYRQNLEYIDQIIENVGRLSRDLSPSILEDLGLTPALRRLIDNFTKNYGVPVASDLMDIGHLFSREAQIMLYRIFQEALTNIGKHAQAKNVTIQIRQDEERVFFFLEDDGRGFDVRRLSITKPSEKGLGLAIMDERTRMLGGFLDLKSETGKGTRLSLSIPIPRKESV